VLPKTSRLRKTKDIERVFKKGKAYKEGFLILKLLKNNLAVGRFAFVVGQKVSKKANIRNKTKRRMREATRKKMPNIRPGFDGIFIALKGLETKNYRETEETIGQLLRKAGVCR